MILRGLRKVSPVVPRIFSAASRPFHPSCQIPKKIFSPSNFVYRRCCHNEVTIDGSDKQIGQLDVKINLMYKCQVCETHNSHFISRQAYEKGVVIVTCEGCKNKHLIADNLNWFQDIKEKNVEEMLAKKGELVLKVKAVPEVQKEYSE